MRPAAAALTYQDSYVMWILTLIVLGLTMFQLLRTEPAKPRRPRSAASQVGTVVAWLIIALIAMYAISQQQ